MRLLLTRAAKDSARTRAKLEAMGHEVLVSPILDMEATGANWPRGVVDAVLGTSAQAFAMLKHGPSPEAKRVMPLFLVGERTADTAGASGFSGALTVAPNAAALARIIENLPNCPRRLVYLAGSDRKPDLERAMAKIDVALEILDVYAAISATSLDAATKIALHLGAIDGVLHFSRRSAKVFCDLAGTDAIDVKRIPHFCLSDDVAVPLSAADCTDLRIAEAPNEAALLILLDKGLGAPS